MVRLRCLKQNGRGLNNKQTAKLTCVCWIVLCVRFVKRKLNANIHNLNCRCVGQAKNFWTNTKEQLTHNQAKHKTFNTFMFSEHYINDLVVVGSADVCCCCSNDVDVAALALFSRARA